MPGFGTTCNNAAMEHRRDRPEGSGPGLCPGCRWSRTVESSRGASFVRCERAAVDPTYPKYPRLPRLECAGYEPAGPECS